MLKRAWNWCRRVLWSDMGLGAKMTTLFIISTLVLIALFAYLGTVALAENTQRTLQDRIVLAQTTARHIDYVLGSIQKGLTDAAAQGAWSDPKQVQTSLEQAFHQLDFYTTQVFLVNRDGYATDAYPPIQSAISFQDFASLSTVLNGEPFAVSRYQRPLGTLAPSTMAFAPICDQAGHVTGALAVSINLTSPNIRTFANPIGLGETGYIDLVDLRGVILVSTRPERIGQPSDHREALAQLITDHHGTISTCHDCHSGLASSQRIREVLAFAPLEAARWGVTVHQSESEIFSATHLLQMRILGLIVVVIAGALLLAYVSTRSVILPVQALTAATQRIAEGDLQTPLTLSGDDEIGRLARSFDAMRLRLKDSIAEIQSWNRELDERVQEGMTKYRAALEQKEQLRDELLRSVIAAQEEERKRISRELHDETCQLLTGLAYALDNAEQATSLTEVQSLLEQMHALTETTLNGVHRIIYDLRPSLLDNLGLIPALRWFAESRLQFQNIQFQFHQIGEPRRLPPPVETAVFRVVQEAINNIVVHSQARHADFSFEFGDRRVGIRITDDGVGFDPVSVTHSPEIPRGLGLLGMQERMNAIGGQLVLRSVPGGGTAICLGVPVEPPTARDGKEEHAE